MLKHLSLAFILAFSGVKLPPKQLRSVQQETYFYQQDFESYNGQAADSYAFHNIGMVCDAASKSVINSGENIDGYSYKAGGTGYCSSNGLLCFRANTIPFKEHGNNYYTTSFDVRIVNASLFGFSYLEAEVDRNLGEISFEPADVENSASCSTKYYSIDDSNGYYHVEFDFKYETCESWGTFFASFGEGGGYIVVDNFKVKVSENDYSINYEKTTFYNQNFDSMSGSGASTLWDQDKLFWFNDTVDVSISTVEAKKGLLYTEINNDEYSIYGGIGSGAINNLSKLEKNKRYTLSMYVKINSEQEGKTFYVEPQFAEWTGVKIVDGVAIAQNNATTFNVKYENNILSFDFVATSEGSNAYIKIVSQNLKIGDSIFVDDFEIYQLHEVNPDDEYKYIQRFEDKLTSGTMAEHLWNNLFWCSDAPIAEFVKGTAAIDGQSLKLGQTTAGTYSQNNMFCSKSYSNPFQTEDNTYTIGFDVKFNNVEQFTYLLKENDINTVIGKISFDPNDLQNAETNNPNYLIKEIDGYYHIELDVTTKTSSNWSDFIITFGENGGYIIIDNIFIKESKNAQVEERILFCDRYENYKGGISIGDYLWQNTHFYSGSDKLSIEDGINNKSIVSRMPAGYYRGETLFGLQAGNGSGATLIEKDSIYEVSFDFKTENVPSFGMVLMYLDPNRGDITFGSLSINMVTKTYSCELAARVSFNEQYNHAKVQFKAPMSTLMFGYFECTSEDNGVLIFDNYSMKSLSNYTIPMAITSFENAEIAPFTIETNKTKEEKLLAKITNDQSQVINGKYSALCGFDASKITIDSEKWGALLKLNESFDANYHYCVQFRFKVISPSENFFYLEIGGAQGLYTRFNESGIVSSSSDVESEVVPEDDHYILKANFDIKNNLNNLLVATYGGGFIVIDDIVVQQGNNYPELPEISKEQLSATKVFSEGFEKQNAGNYLSFKSFISGVDVFDTILGYNEKAIDGKVSAVIRCGSYWAEQISTKDGVLEANTVYSFAFRYKPFEISQGNLTIIVRGSSEKYIAISLDGKDLGFTSSGNSFYKSMDLVKVVQKDGYNEVYVTFLSPSENPKLVIGTYGINEIAIDDCTLFKGDYATFDSDEVSVIQTANRDNLKSLINTYSSYDLTLFSEESKNNFTTKLNEAKRLYSNLDCSQNEIDAAIVNLNNAYGALQEQAYLDFVNKFNAISSASNKKEMYQSIVEAINQYKQIKDKEKASSMYQQLEVKIQEYNTYVNSINNSFKMNKQQVIAFSSILLLLIFLFKARRCIL